MISEADAPRVAQSWFMGMNPALDDDAPARLLREGELDSVEPQLVGATRAFRSLMSRDVEPVLPEGPVYRIARGRALFRPPR